MLILGLQGSPRKKGNTRYLLETFMQSAAKRGAHTEIVDVTRKDIIACKELVVCEKKGYCPIEDDVLKEIYPLLRRAEIVVLASPIFFYNMTAQLKAVVDRCQTFWARKYRFKLADPAKSMRRGFVLSVAATRGKNLFEGLLLSAKYFFDAIDARYEGSLTYRGIEGPGDMAGHPGAVEEIDRTVDQLMAPFKNRTPVLFAGHDNACRSQMAAAFAQSLAGDRLDALSAGGRPAEKVNPDMAKTMQELKIDMAYRRPQSIEAALESLTPRVVVTMGGGEQAPAVTGARYVEWDVPDPAGLPVEKIRGIRDDIRARVNALVKDIDNEQPA
jgi:multimeric flavodoxin WrbA